MLFFTGLFTYALPQAGVEAYNLTKLCLYVCMCVYVCVIMVVRWIIIQTSPVFVFSVLLIVGNPLLIGLTIFCLCIHV